MASQRLAGYPRQDSNLQPTAQKALAPSIRPKRTEILIAGAPHSVENVLDRARDDEPPRLRGAQAKRARRALHGPAAVAPDFPTNFPTADVGLKGSLQIA
jgi:hypothetical protein